MVAPTETVAHRVGAPQTAASQIALSQIAATRVTASQIAALGSPVLQDPVSTPFSRTRPYDPAVTSVGARRSRRRAARMG